MMQQSAGCFEKIESDWIVAGKGRNERSLMSCSFD